MRFEPSRRKSGWRTFVEVTGAALSAALVVTACSPAGGTASAPPSGAVAQLAAKVADAQNLLAAEVSTKQKITITLAHVPKGYCDPLVTEFGGTTVPQTVGTQTVNTPVFHVPSTYQVNTHATALRNKQQSKRLWGDATQPALPMDANGKFTLRAVEASICMHPDYASQIIRGLASATMGGITALQVNPWMSQEVPQGAPSPMQTVRWANYCMDGGTDVQVRCAEVMRATAYLIGQFTYLGIHRDTTDWYFRLQTGLVVGNVPPLQSILGSYTGWFLEFGATRKAPGECLVRYGINIGKDVMNGGDLRLAGLSCTLQRKPAPVVSAKATPTVTMTQPASSPPSSRSPKPSPSMSKTPKPSPSSSSPVPSSPPPSTYTPSPSPSTTAPSSSPPATYSPSPSPSASSTSPSPCPCHSTPPPSESPCPCHSHSPSATPTVSETPTDTASPTPSPTCTCQDVAQVTAYAEEHGYNLLDFGSMPPRGSLTTAA